MEFFKIIHLTQSVETTLNYANFCEIKLYDLVFLKKSIQTLLVSISQCIVFFEKNLKLAICLKYKFI